MLSRQVISGSSAGALLAQQRDHPEPEKSLGGDWIEERHG
jgi:hypothetical protein